MSVLTQDELKTLVGQAALAHVTPGSIVGVGTGSTVDKFIDALGQALKLDPGFVAGAVSSSVRSTERLEGLGVKVLPSESVTSLGVYIDGADEIDHQGHMVKGGGAALTREKIVAELAERGLKSFVLVHGVLFAGVFGHGPQCCYRHDPILPLFHSPARVAKRSGQMGPKLCACFVP